MSWVIVLGATSAIAQATAHRLAKQGHDLLLGARDTKEAQAIASDLALRHAVRTQVFAFDALAMDEHPKLMEGVLETAGDELAGIVVTVGMLGDQEQARHDPDLARRILETNLTGVVTALTPVADRLAELGDGFVCIVSSVAGDRGRQSNYVYGAAKGGLSLYAQGLRNRLHHEGVTVVTVKPGFVDTKMTWGKEGMFLVASPDQVAGGIVRAIGKGRSTAYVPWFWRPVLWIIRSLPEWLFKRLEL